MSLFDLGNVEYLFYLFIESFGFHSNDAGVSQQPFRVLGYFRIRDDLLDDGNGSYWGFKFMGHVIDKIFLHLGDGSLAKDNK